MSQSIDFDLNLDSSGYVAGAQQAIGATGGLQQALSGVTATSGGVQRALNLISPGRASIAAFAGFTASAAAAQNQLSNLQATQAVTGASAQRLAGGMRGLAREFPIGQRSAQQVVETFTQMGIAGKGTERQILALSKTMVQLSGATGEAPAVLAAGMTQLARATGDSRLDPRKMQGLSDSLTTVSKTSGASAGSILSFSKAIAPMAQSAGIGATGVLGISAAFSRLGEDGYGAANALNKMLSDMNRSVREGGNEMSAYAEIVGTTTNQFEKLYKANPTEALTQVTEAISKAGTKGPRELEMLGLDGVRTQRYLQALTQSGGLRSAVATATSAYGNDSTAKASQAAFGGLTDSLGQLASTTGQVSEAMGRPLLGAMTAFTNVLKVPVNILRAIIDSPIGQMAVGGGTAALGGLLLARKGFRAVAGIGMASQALTSGPMRSLAGGLALGRAGSEEAALASRLGRFGSPMMEAENEGRLGKGFMGSINRPLFYGAQGFAEHRAGLKAERDTAFKEAHPEEYAAREAHREALAGRSTIGRVVGRIAEPVTLGMETYSRLIAEQVRQPQIKDPSRRADGSLITPHGAVSVLGDTFKQSWKETVGTTGAGGLGEFLNRTGQSLRTFNQTIDDGTRKFPNLMRAIAAGSRVTTEGAHLTASLGGQALNSAGKGLAGMISNIGPAQLALMGVSAGIAGYSMLQSKRKQEDEHTANLDIYSTLNDYRTAMGKATEATMTLTEQYAQNNKTIAMTVTDMNRARTYTAEDQSQSAGMKSPIAHRFVGNASQQAAQISAISTNGLAPDELHAIALDLGRQPGATRASVNDILSRVNMPDSSKPQTGQQLAGYDPAQLADITAAAAKSSAGYGAPGLVHGLRATPFGFGPFRRGHLLNPDRVGPDAGKALDLETSSIGQRFNVQKDEFGLSYARQEQARQMNTAIQAAMKSGNEDTVLQLGRRFSQMLTGGKSKAISSMEILQSGGDFTKALAHRDKNYAKTWTDLVADPNFDPVGLRQGIKPTSQASPLTEQLKNTGPLGTYFSNLAPYASRPVNDQVNKALAKPEDASLVTGAVESMVADMNKAGQSFQDIAGSATSAANTLKNSAGTPYQLAQKVAAEAQFQLRGQMPFMRPGQQASAQLEQYQSLANMDPANPEMAGARQQGREGIQDLRSGLGEQMKARLSMQREFEISRSRTTADYDLSRRNAAADYNRSIARAEESYNISVARAERNYQRQRSRGYAEFKINELQVTQDYNLSIKRAEEDFNRARARATRDFNIQMARQVEDQAKAIYDPYHRITTQAVWDGRQLLVNLQEQATAMKTQQTNLGRARHMGLSPQVIDLLGLGKSENSQQLAKLIADMMSDPKLAAQLNATAGNRLNLTSAFVNDPSNKETVRAKEDFNRSLADQQKDFTLSMNRQQADFTKQMGRSRTSFNRQMAYAAQDFHTSLEDMSADQHLALARAAKDQAIAMSRAETQFNTSMKRMDADLKRQDEVISADFNTLMAETMKALNGQAVDWGKVVTKNIAGTIASVGKSLAAADKKFATMTFGGLAGGGSTGVGAMLGQMQGGGFSSYGNGSSFPSGNGSWGPPGSSLTSVSIGGHAATVNSAAAANFAGFGNALAASGYKIHDVGGYNNRNIAGTSTKSDHAWGLAIDINASQNGLGTGHGNLPFGVNQLAAKYGLTWGGEWSSKNDPMHFDFSSAPSASASLAHHYGLPGPHMALGGVLTKAQHFTAGEAGPEAVIPLDSRGVRVMADAMSRYINNDQARTMIVGDRHTPIVYHGETYNYDHSTQFTGAIRVEASDPDEMARKLARKQRSDNLTKSRR